MEQTKQKPKVSYAQAVGAKTQLAYPSLQQVLDKRVEHAKLIFHTDDSKLKSDLKQLCGNDELVFATAFSKATHATDIIKKLRKESQSQYNPNLTIGIKDRTEIEKMVFDPLEPSSLVNATTFDELHTMLIKYQGYYKPGYLQYVANQLPYFRQ